MLIPQNRKERFVLHRRRQQGVVLIIALIVLVAMTLAGISLVRSVDTGNLIAGNMALQQSAVHAGDAGIEEAIAWIQTPGISLDNDDPTQGYVSDALNPAKQFSPAAGQSWDAFWTANLAENARKWNGGEADVNTGNKVSYVIHRLCQQAGPKNTAKCAISPVVSADSGNEEEAGSPQLAARAVAYYRITARIDGPKNTVSYVQAVVSM